MSSYAVHRLTPLVLLCFLASPPDIVAHGLEQEPTHPRSFVTILEEARDGSLQDRSSAGRFSIMDRRAIVHVRFDRQRLQAALGDENDLQAQLDGLGDYLQTLQDSQRDIQQSIRQRQIGYAQGNITTDALEQELVSLRQRLQNVRELQVAEVEQLFRDGNSFQLSVVARVVPVSGAPFDLSVEGYTDIRLAESTVSPASATAVAEADTSQDADDDAASILRSIVTETTIRPYRYEPRWVGGQRLEAVLVDDVQDAVIQLPSDQLEDGDRIEITVVNYGSQRPRSYTWRVEVRDLGATLRTDPTLLLVKRATAPSGDSESFSDYKPAPGTSFVWEVRTRKEWWNNLDFRFGVNGSFVDLRSDKDFEVGVGPVISFANGLVQFTYGWNLHAGGQRYWALGLGFLDIKDRVAARGR